MKRIVVGYDGSEHARRALEEAANLAGDAAVTVISAVDVSGAGGHGNPGADPEETTERSKELSEARAFLEGKGIKVDTSESYGDPADSLIDAARDSDADLIIVGTRDLNAVKEILLGSVSTKVVHHAPCSVLVAR